MKWPWRQRTLYALPNRYGGVIFGIFFIFILAGAAYSNNLVFMVGFLILSFTFTSILQTARTIRNLEVLSVNVTSQSVDRSTAGQVTIQNPTNQYKPKFLLELKEINAKFEVPELLPNETRVISFSLKLPNKRGLYPLKIVRISTSSPYGMFKAWMYVKIPDQFVVYPRLYGRSDLPMQIDVMGESFSGHREHAAGDTFSRVDWKIYARTRETFVKEFKDSSTKTVVIDWNKVNIANVEEKISQIALWIDRAHIQHLDFGVRIPGYESPVQTGLQHYHECMKELSTLEL